MFERCGVLAAAIVVSGCVVSVDTFVSDSAVAIDPRLLGAWEQVAGSDRAVVSGATQTTYAIEYTSDGRTGRFEARLGRLGDHLVLDVWPSPDNSGVLQPYAGLLVAGHLLLDLDIGPNELRVAVLDLDSLLTALRAGQVRLAHGRFGDQLVLYGTTEELGSALASYIGRSGALAAPDVWRRARGAAASALLRPVAVPCFEASAWRGADQLFHRDPHWVGGDGTSSLDLGDGRILWLFGDSWIDPSGRGTRQGARMVSNSVAIQTGTDPTTASMRFYWGQAADGGPAAFVPDHADERYWFGNGLRVRDRVILFLVRVRNVSAGLGFEVLGWNAWIVDNPAMEPSAWRLRKLETRGNPLGVLLGAGAVGQIGEHVYAFGDADPIRAHPVYVARWPVEQVHQGNLREPEWWAGEGLGWIPDSSDAPRRPLFTGGVGKIHRDPVSQHFLAVQTQGFGPADVMMRAAPTLTGPWSEPRVVYRPPEYYRPNVMIYLARAHPELTGGDLVLTYDTNTFQAAEHLTDNAIYYPRFVRLTRCG